MYVSTYEERAFKMQLSHMAMQRAFLSEYL